jgi:cytochrome b
MDHAMGAATRYRVWDRTTRLFHWINFCCVLALSALAIVMLNGKLLGLSHDGSILLKTVHAYVGYVFAINLGWRLVWAFVGNRHARWAAFLPGGKGFAAALGRQVRSLRSGYDLPYVGHSPLARIMIGGLLVLLVVQAMTGLLLAGTDLYLPPFGGYMADWVTGGDPSRLAQLQPGSTEHVVSGAYEAMRGFRRPVKLTHEFGFYVLLTAIALHILANILEDVRYGTGQISAMFSGIKTLRGKPVDDAGD